MNTKRIVIIGVGPTGLGAAHRLQELEENNWVVLEAGDYPGGLASSEVDECGFTWDLGSHLQHSHYATFDQYMDLALSSNEWIQHTRSTWVWLCDRFVPYPLQLNLHRLPSGERQRCLVRLIKAQQNPQLTVQHFGQWILATFGE